MNNAGSAGADVPPHELETSEFDQVLDVDVRGVYICSKNAIPYLLESKGNIVNLGSCCGTVCSMPNLTAYFTAKGAVHQMTKSFAVTYAKQGVRCNAVAPGTILTPFNEQFAKDFYGTLENYIDFIGPNMPMGTIGMPDDVAWAIVYLASDEAKWVTGAILPVDGGWVAS